MSNKRKLYPILLGISFTSAATLIFEISLTRLFSISQWYHFAFMVVSIALLGFGASGSFFFVLPKLLKKNTNYLLTIFSLLFSISCLISYLILNQLLFDPFRLSWDIKQLFLILIYYLVLSIPFFFAGSCLTIALSKLAEKANKLYFLDLLGAGLGSILIIWIFPYFAGSKMVIFTSILAGFASFFFSLNLPKKVSSLILIQLLVLIFLLIYPQPFLALEISPYKSLNIALNYPEAKILETHWNAFSRVDVIESPFVRFAPGLSLKYTQNIPPQKGLTVDGDGLNAITYYDGQKSTIEFVDFLPSSLPYKLGKNQNVLIIEPSGGLSILTALYNDVQSIEAVEINPLIIDIIKNKYADFSGYLYEQEKVRIHLSEGRSFIKRSSQKYDLIELSLTNNPSAASTGLYSLAENYLYTTEAFRDYYNHLADKGMLSITRYLIPPPREEIRLISLSIEALRSLGIKHPEENLAVIRSWGTITILLKKNGFTKEDSILIRDFCQQRKFDLVYLPGIKKEEVNLYNRFPEPYYYQMVKDLLSAENLSEFYDAYMFDISPVNDDRPFFFHFFKWKKIATLYQSMGEKWQPFLEGGYLIPVIFIQALIATLLFIFLPLLFKKGISKKIYGKNEILIYFFLLGIGYMFIEISLIQKFILFLGHPVYSISIVLFSLLTSSGLGSFVSKKFLKIDEAIDKRRLKIVFGGLCLLIIIYFFTLSFLFNLFLGRKLFFRFLISLFLITPLGFLMGFPFPTGILLLNKVETDLIPWAWCINGCSSVLSSVLVMVIALSFGFSKVLLLSALVYLGAFKMIMSFTATSFSS